MRIRDLLSFVGTVLLLLFSVKVSDAAVPENRRDAHSFSNPEHVRVTHLDLTLTVDFERQVIKIRVVLQVKRTSDRDDVPLILDTRDLHIEAVAASTDGTTFEKAEFTLGDTDEALGTPLTVELPAKVTSVRIDYRTRPGASGLQWLGREQTASKRSPFLFTQSQAIHARSWIPLQDSPGLRVTYNARVHVPKELFAVMSASNVTEKSPEGQYTFVMKQPIPSYLIALAVGELTFKPIGPRTGVYAELPVIDDAVSEFADMEKMLRAVEELYGPYRWDRYDVLVLPPSFPFGGMENPRLTFATPTILAGDRSLVSLIAHELAHSWSGNLVTNATWRDFWLNEGFTVYLERRIQEAIYGEQRAKMEAALGRRDLESSLQKIDEADQILYIDLEGRDPDEGLTDIPYEKGALFLLHLEKTFGRERFDAFLKSYFDHFVFQSITTVDFIEYLDEHLLKKHPELAAQVPVEEWVYKPGIPKVAPRLTADAFVTIESQADHWVRGELAAKDVPVAPWTTQEWLHFLRSLPTDLTPEQMKQLDDALELTNVGNSEILFQWLLMSIQHQYTPAYPRVREFLTSMGRRKFLQPLYEEMVKTLDGKERALTIYKEARSTYHPIAVNTIDAIVGWRK